MRPGDYVRPVDERRIYLVLYVSPDGSCTIERDGVVKEFTEDRLYVLTEGEKNGLPYQPWELEEWPET